MFRKAVEAQQVNEYIYIFFKVILQDMKFYIQIKGAGRRLWRSPNLPAGPPDENSGCQSQAMLLGVSAALSPSLNFTRRGLGKKEEITL